MSHKLTIEDVISGHEIRNAKLRQLFVDKNIDLDEPRKIEFHFWAGRQEDAADLAEALRRQGFEVLTMRPAATRDEPERWNLEAAVRQSIRLTMRREFIEQLVRLARSDNGIYDGWGTSI